LGRENWTRDELIVAYNLYCKTPFTKINSSNKGVVELSKIIGRSVSAVALKLANYARLDPALQNRNISGMKHGSKGEEIIWNEFNNNWDELSLESEKLLAQFKGVSLEKSAEIETIDIPEVGLEREAIIMARVNQGFFRKTVLSSYDNKCCVTGIEIPELLIASHIIPWKGNEKLRLNPQNGICINRLHDKAFDAGYMTIDNNYKIKLSPAIKKLESKDWIQKFFLPYDNKEIILPQRFYPDKICLEYHYDNIFIK
jgi:putative restriction endonuclease